MKPATKARGQHLRFFFPRERKSPFDKGKRWTPKLSFTLEEAAAITTPYKNLYICEVCGLIHMTDHGKKK